jgi:GTPase SAR1 family protein
MLKTLILVILLHIREACVPSRIVAFGVTGAGKSTLLNRLCGQSIFPEGNNLNSKTKTQQASTCRWLGHGSEVEVYDTPGFFDVDGDSFQLLNFLINFLKDLRNQGGFTLGLFLIPVTSARLDIAHSRSLGFLQTLMGNECLNHIKIVLTQSNRLDPGIRELAVHRYLTEGPGILQGSGIKAISQNSFVRCDFEVMVSCAAELERTLSVTGNFVPLGLEKFRGNDIEDIGRLLAKQEYAANHSELERQQVEMRRKEEEMRLENERIRREMQEREDRMRECIDRVISEDPDFPYYRDPETFCYPRVYGAQN